MASWNRITNGTPATPSLFNGIFDALLAGQVFNVKWSTFGATGDGVTDDTEAIQAAIDAAFAAGGGVVLFPHGTYVVTSSLTLYSGITLRGVSERCSVIRITANDVDAVRITGTSLSSLIVQVNIDSLKIEGPGEASGSTGRGVYVQYGAVGINFRNLWIAGHGSHGIQFDNSYSATLQDLLLDSNGGDGFHAETNANNISFLRTLAINNTGCGYKVIGGTTLMFENANAELNDDAGFDLRYVYCPTLDGCHMEGNGRNGTSPNVYLHWRSGSGEPCTAGEMRGCVVQGAGTTADGLVIDGANGFQYSGNWFSNHLTDHVRTTANATRTVVWPNTYAGTGNILTDNSPSSVRLNVDPTHLIWSMKPALNFEAVSSPGSNPAGTLYRSTLFGGHLRYKADDGIQRSVLIGLEGSGNLAFGTVPANSTKELTITVSGAAVGDSVTLHVSTLLEPGLIIGAPWVSATDTVKVRVGNVTTADIIATTAGYRARVIKTQL